MSAPINKPLFKGSVLTGTTFYVQVPIYRNAIGAMVMWTDTTTAAAITMEYSDLDPEEAPFAVAGTADQWSASGVVITGPAGGSVGNAKVEASFAPHKRARLKIVTSAASVFDIRNGIQAD